MPITAVLHTSPGAGSRKVTLEPPVSNSEPRSPPGGTDGERSGSSSTEGSPKTLAKQRRNSLAEQRPSLPGGPDGEKSGSAEVSPKMQAKRRASISNGEKASSPGGSDGEKSGSAEGSAKMLARRRSSVSKPTFSTSSQDGWAGAENSRLHREVRAHSYHVAAPVASRPPKPT